jgi:hypothetical protein
MPARIPPTKAQFDALLPKLEAYARDWAERECTTFDEAVLGKPKKENEDDGSIWDMPAIDSKRVVALLVELEQMIDEKCRLPVSAIKSGGYANADDLVAKLLPKLREKCPDSNKPGVASTSAPPPASDAPPAQVLP